MRLVNDVQPAAAEPCAQLVARKTTVVGIEEDTEVRSIVEVLVIDAFLEKLGDLTITLEDPTVPSFLVEDGEISCSDSSAANFRGVRDCSHYLSFY